MKSNGERGNILEGLGQLSIEVLVLWIQIAKGIRRRNESKERGITGI